MAAGGQVLPSSSEPSLQCLVPSHLSALSMQTPLRHRNLSGLLQVLLSSMFFVCIYIIVNIWAYWSRYWLVQIVCQAPFCQCVFVSG